MKYDFLWTRIEEVQGPDALRRKGSNKVWTPEEKLTLVSKVIDEYQTTMYNILHRSLVEDLWISK